MFPKQYRFNISTFDKVLVELGMGNGQLLAKILEYRNSPNTFYVGIEIDPKQIQKARDKLIEKYLLD